MVQCVIYIRNCHLSKIRCVGCLTSVAKWSPTDVQKNKILLKKNVQNSAAQVFFSFSNKILYVQSTYLILVQ